jgi:hypothetical protein
VPQGLKPSSFDCCTARLKSCPDTKQNFSSLFSRAVNGLRASANLRLICRSDSIRQPHGNGRIRGNLSTSPVLRDFGR